MADSVSVRCPACRLEHAFVPTTFPCPCGTPLTVPILPGQASTQVGQRRWRDSWVTLRCPSCRREHDWPHPQLCCSCGVVIRLPTGRDGARPAAGHPPAGHPVFEPVTIRTGEDAVTAAARYLEWLGFTGVVIAGDRFTAAVDVRGDGLLARADPSTRPCGPREVETLWLDCLHQEATGAFFSLAGFTAPARECADGLGLALFAMDLTGAPAAVNDPARRLAAGRP